MLEIIFKKSPFQKMFSYDSICERICVCDWERNDSNIKVQEITPVNSSIKYDCKITSGDNLTWIVETKNRYINSTDYPDFWIELDKLEDLKYYSKRDNQPAKFMLLFDDCSLMWDVADIYYRWHYTNETGITDKKYKKYTSDPNSEEVIHKIIKLKPEWASKIEFKRKEKEKLKKQAIQWYTNNSKKTELLNSTWSRSR